MNPVRVRWRLERLAQRRQQAARRREQRVEHIRYEHKTCPQCHAVHDRDEKICTRCGAEIGRRSFQVLRRLGLVAPSISSISLLVGLALVVVYVRVALASRAAGGGMISFHPLLLIAFGGHFPPSVQEGEVWRLLTAVVLHAGLWHIAFNLVALAIVGPQIEALYGRFVMLFILFATGVVANVGSGLAGLHGVGIGASGGIMGLCGAAAGWGQREGTGRGRAVRNDMLKWAAYTIFFGFMIGADNWAHAVGFASGGVFGFAIRPSTLARRGLRPVRILLGTIGIALALTAVGLALWPPAGVDARPLTPSREEEAFRTMCAAPRDDNARDICELFHAQRRWCRASPAEKDKAIQISPSICADLERMFGPDPPPPPR